MAGYKPAHAATGACVATAAVTENRQVSDEQSGRETVVSENLKYRNVVLLVSSQMIVSHLYQMAARAGIEPATK